VTIHHHETQGLFGGVVGGWDFRRRDEAKVAFAMLAKAVRQILDETVDFAVGITTGMKNRLQRGIPDFVFGGGQGSRKSPWAELVPAMEGVEKPLELGQEGLAVTLDGRLGKIAQVFDLADQMGQAELNQDAAGASVFAIGASEIGAQAASVVLAQDIH